MAVSASTTESIPLTWEKTLTIDISDTDIHITSDGIDKTYNNTDEVHHLDIVEQYNYTLVIPEGVNGSVLREMMLNALGEQMRNYRAYHDETVFPLCNFRIQNLTEQVEAFSLDLNDARDKNMKLQENSSKLGEKEEEVSSLQVYITFWICMAIMFALMFFLALAEIKYGGIFKIKHGFGRGK